MCVCLCVLCERAVWCIRDRQREKRLTERAREKREETRERREREETDRARAREERRETRKRRETRESRESTRTCEISCVTPPSIPPSLPSSLPSSSVCLLICTDKVHHTVSAGTATRLRTFSLLLPRLPPWREMLATYVCGTAKPYLFKRYSVVPRQVVVAREGGREGGGAREH